MSIPLPNPHFRLVISSFFSHGKGGGGGKGKLPNAVPLNSLHGVPSLTIPMPICSCDKSPGCYIGKSIGLYSSKFILSKILSS